MECFISSKMKILYTFIFTCFLDRFQSVLHQFLDQFFMRIVIFYFHQIYLYSSAHFCQLCLKNCHIFQTFIKFRLLFEFLWVYFLTFILISIFPIIYLVQRVSTFALLKTQLHRNDKKYVHDHSTLVQSFYYDILCNLRIFSLNLIRFWYLWFHKHFWASVFRNK